MDEVIEGDLTQFLNEVKGPAVIGFEPTIYPACVRCGHAWLLRRTNGVWAWFPDCEHKNDSCKLAHA